MGYQDIVIAIPEPFRSHSGALPERSPLVLGRSTAARDQGDPIGTAEITTSACAIGPSSVMVTSFRASQPAGVIALSRLSAPPVSFMVGRPEGRLTTPMSRQKTPALSPVPSAFAQASFAAKRLA